MVGMQTIVTHVICIICIPGGTHTLMVGMQTIVTRVICIICIPGGTHTQGNVRMCSARLVSSTWPSDDSSKPATATLTP